MRKFLSTLAIGLLTSSSLMASWSTWTNWYNDLVTTSCGCEDWPSPVHVYFGWGYRQDKFKWSIAGPNNVPNILSELRWKDLRISQIGGDASYVSYRNYAIRIAGDYGHIYHGNNTDADFHQKLVPDTDSTTPRDKDFETRKKLFSLSKNDAGKGYVYDLNGGVGYRCMSNCGRFIGTPLVGYAWHGQSLHIFNGNQVIDTVTCEIGPFPGLNSKYKARWYGPWVGIDFRVQVECCASIFGNFEWHQTKYRGTGCWNLRSDLGPFHHKAYGHGYVLTLGGNWEIWKTFSIGIVGNYRHFRTGHGRETLEVIHGPDCIEHSETRFNGAKWVSWSISGLIAWRY